VAASQVGAAAADTKYMTPDSFVKKLRVPVAPIPE
jgi:hypothetical protein